MAIPILPLPAGGTGLQALMGGFQQGIQNAGQIQKNRLNQLLTAAQATKNKHLEASLTAAQQAQDLRNQLLQGQVSEQTPAFNMQQALQGQELKNSQQSYSQSAQKFPLSLNMLKAQNNLINAKIQAMNDPTTPQGKLYGAYMKSGQTNGWQNPQTLYLLAAANKALQSAGTNVVVNSGVPSISSNGSDVSAPAASGAPNMQNFAYQPPQASPASQPATAPMAAMSNPNASSMPQAPQMPGSNVAASAAPVMQQSAPPPQSQVVANPLSLHNSRGSTAGTVFKDLITGKEISTPVNSTAGRLQLASVGERNALSSLDDYRAKVRPLLPDTFGYAAAPMRMAAEVGQGVGLSNKYAPYSAAVQNDLPNVIESSLQASNLNKTGALVKFTHDSYTPDPNNETKSSFDQKNATGTANLWVKGDLADQSLKGVMLNSGYPSTTKYSDYILKGWKAGVPTPVLFENRLTGQIPVPVPPNNGNFPNAAAAKAWINQFPVWQRRLIVQSLPKKK